MSTFSSRHALMIGLLLAALPAVTRGTHFDTLSALPDASWAAFFLAGVYLRPIWAFALLFGEIVLLDLLALAADAAAGFCISPAYGFLLPAYGALWSAGRRYAARHRPRPATLGPLGADLLTGAVACELLSSGGFYFFSGRFADPDLAGFIAREAHWFPSYLATLTFYVGIAALMHVTLTAGARGTRRRTMAAA